MLPRVLRKKTRVNMSRTQIRAHAITLFSSIIIIIIIVNYLFSSSNKVTSMKHLAVDAWHLAMSGTLILTSRRMLSDNWENGEHSAESPK